jgi:hypothetical protein
MKSHASGMWWVVIIMVVRANFLPTELFVHKADEVLHISSWLADSAASTCCDDG